MLGLSSGLIQDGGVTSEPQTFTYASMFTTNPSSYTEWNFDPCDLSNIAIYSTGGLASNDNHALIAWLGGTFSDECRTWTGNLLSTSDLEGGIQNGDVITLSYEMFIGSGNDKWSPGDGSAVAINTTISGFNAVSTNFTPETTPNASYTAVNIEVTKSGGTQNEGLIVEIGPFSQALTGASSYIRKINATVNRPA